MPVLIPLHEEIIGEESSYGPVTIGDVFILGMVISGRDVDPDIFGMSLTILEEIGYIERGGKGYRAHDRFIPSLTERKVTSTKTRRQNLLDTVNRITGRKLRVLPEKGVAKTLAAFTDLEIEKALTALASDPWHKERIKGLGIDYLIRSTVIDKYLKESPVSNVLNDEPLARI